LINNTHKTYIL